MDEEWMDIQEFPDYQISNYGRVLNKDTERILRESKTYDGTIKIGLIFNGKQCTRSVKSLVAQTFVSGQTENRNTAIQMDGDQSNTRADNLAWRSRAFAWKYNHQFREYCAGQDKGLIRNEQTGELYPTMVEAAKANGVLIIDVWKSVWMQYPVYPEWLQFTLAR